MACSHDDMHSVSTAYDRSSGVLVYFWTCELCGQRLGEARRESYRPDFDPHGNERFIRRPFPVSVQPSG